MTGYSGYHVCVCRSKLKVVKKNRQKVSSHSFCSSLSLSLSPHPVFYPPPNLSPARFTLRHFQFCLPRSRPRPLDHLLLCPTLILTDRGTWLCFQTSFFIFHPWHIIESRPCRIWISIISEHMWQLRNEVLVLYLPYFLLFSPTFCSKISFKTCTSLLFILSFVVQMVFPWPPNLLDSFSLSLSPSVFPNLPLSDSGSWLAAFLLCSLWIEQQRQDMTGWKLTNMTNAPCLPLHLPPFSIYRRSHSHTLAHSYILSYSFVPAWPSIVISKC